MPDQTLTDRGIRVLKAEDLRSTVAHLELRPDRDLYLRALVRQHGVSLHPSWGRLVGWFPDGQLAGVFLHSSALLLSCERPLGTVAFAEWVAKSWASVPTTQLIAPRSMVITFRKALEQQLPVVPRVQLLRDRMHAMRLERAGLPALVELPRPPLAMQCSLRRAVWSDRPLVRTASCAVTREELGIDPEEFDPKAFALALDHRIRVGREYVWEHDGTLLFRASVAAVTDESVLVEGVYVPPQSRGQGFGSLGMHALCQKLLKRHRRVLLLVGADNQRAVGLYRRIGFQPRDDFQAVYFSASKLVTEVTS